MCFLLVGIHTNKMFEFVSFQIGKMRRKSDSIDFWVSTRYFYLVFLCVCVCVSPTITVGLWSRSQSSLARFCLSFPFLCDLDGSIIYYTKVHCKKNIPGQYYSCISIQGILVLIFTRWKSRYMQWYYLL